ncbi:hypothetical protein QR680_013146 [Steinernema hermaphroditum]|uniref:RanBD1 domain-containing protein n=1 Tax=Steinernema hermaphroditum TaxID=289476 RepID=A0AA39M222_9BILA|nr:hypothetical protein QR680_013146 [Steinernema hermaphroditum]
MQFQEKLGLLNRNFLAYLTHAIGKTPNADFSPTVRDYLKHVGELDNIYAKPSEPKKRKTENADEPVPKTGILKSSSSTSNDGAQSKKAVTFGEEDEMKRVDKVRKLLAKTPKPKSNFNPEELRASRKRSKFGAEDEVETVTFKSRLDQGNGAADKTEAPKIPEFLTKAQSEGASFWKKKNLPSDGDGESPKLDGVQKPEEAFKSGCKPFTFGVFSKTNTSSPTSTVEKAQKADDSSKSSDKFFTFDVFSKTSASSPTSTSEKAQKVDDSSKSSDRSFTFGVFSKTSSSTPTSTTEGEKAPLTFGFMSKSKPAEDKPVSAAVDKDKAEKPATSESTPTGFTSFWGNKSVSQEGSDGTPKADDKPGFTFGVFSKTSSLTPTSTVQPEQPLTFGFVAKPKPAEVEASDNNEEVSDEPPKVEAVVNEEPGTIYMSKCGVHLFKNKAYTKLGIGMMYLKKESEESTEETPEIFLLRAATATGTVWANARMKNVTAKSVDAHKITMGVPNAEGTIQTLLLKLPTPDAKDRVLDYLSQK